MSEELSVTGESLQLLENTDMCEACGDKLRFMGKKTCQWCHENFCSKCISSPVPPSPFLKNQQFCIFCCLQKLEVIERSHLSALALLDLRYYAKKKSLNVPINGMKEQLIDVILAGQAKDLADRARRALSLVTEGTDGAAGLEPHSSTYSMTESSVGSTPGLGGVAQDNAGTDTSTSDLLHTPTSPPSADYNNRGSARVDIDISLVTSLSSLTHESQISQLGVKQLKTILQRNCINYRGCVEKRELLEKVVRLWQAREEEMKRLATIAQMGDTDVESEFLCKVCMDSPVDCVLLECGHMLTCVPCGRQLSECPICRQYVTRVVHAFRV